MCNIAGYVGFRQAAPILLEMLGREEKWDAAMGAGIVTVSGGELHLTKVVGNVGVLKSTTDALNFPGTIGICHGHPSPSLVTGYHPFCDDAKTIACVTNGTSRDCMSEEFVENEREITAKLLSAGETFPSRRETNIDGSELDPLERITPDGAYVHGTEVRTKYVAYLMKEKGLSMDDAMVEMVNERGADMVMVGVKRDDDKCIRVCRVTRPMVAAICDGETYIATTRFAFPEDIKPRSIVNLPPNTLTEVYAGYIKITDKHSENTGVEDLTPLMYKIAYERIVSDISGAEEDPWHFDRIEDDVYVNLRYIWQKPLIEARFVNPEGGCLKPYAQLVYDILWQLHTEGKLKVKAGHVEERERFLCWI